MCTSGALSGGRDSEEPVVVIFKTLDAGPTSTWHGFISHPEGYHSIGMGVAPQPGINSGVNEVGLGVVLSYLDFRGPFEDTGEEPPVWEADLRGLANAQVLATCANVDEGVELLYNFFATHQNRVGGNHVLADRSGRIVVFEHCNGEMSHREYSVEGTVSRGNDGLLVADEEQAGLPDKVLEDRHERRKAMQVSLIEAKAGLDSGLLEKEDAIEKIKARLSSHRLGDGTAIGSICAHGVSLPGARFASALSNYTLSAIVLDIFSMEMHYTQGAPCSSPWQLISMSSYVNEVRR